ncbi:nicotinate phosphoribosyltransferase [Thermasporomyces composti]|jgi:nicotinate phosphoribosyltransferase|uniref:Nicotinate phosphoribosyltransferase n=2 Tax=Thermasporomyces composti TaxID=696763 RepID=A0A3D9VHH4_THECX|nr:nicotinate phosphoribosyltransferase [Thermasporomyces composti]REF37644.1 nicotinate phosphoribosyltransferase [Thermasporomyces composti]
MGEMSDELTALYTDQYEFTMLRSALADGTAHRRAVFEVFARRLPDGRRYGVVAGIGRLLDALERFRLDDDSLAFLLDRGVIDEPTAEWLASYRFTGDIWGYAEGECYFPGSPILVVESTFAEAVLLETLTLSILNHDSAIASAASRMATAAGGRALIEMGSRRTHEAAAPAAARAAYIAGFTSTSNLLAGRRYGIPTAGTSAHAFVLLHDSERDAFRAQIETLGRGTTLLVDTFDVREAVRTAVEVAGPGLGAIRIDSGDLPALAHEVRAELDRLGATGTQILVSGDLNEHAIAALAAAPVDAYGVGTALVTGSGAPTAELVYKLVARSTSDDPSAPLIGVAKASTGKPTHKGRKWAHRVIEDGVAVAEVVTTWPDIDRPGRPLLVPLVQRGDIVGREPLEMARERHVRSLAELPPAARQLSWGEPAVPTEYNGAPAYSADGPDGRRATAVEAERTDERRT